MRAQIIISVAVLTGLSLSGCVTSNGPAVLTGSDPAAHAEIEATVSKALNNENVTLAPDVLTTTSRLTIERKQHRSIANNPMQGRIMDRPDHFTLSKSGQQCILMHEETGETYPLSSVDCALIETD